MLVILAQAGSIFCPRGDAIYHREAIPPRWIEKHVAPCKQNIRIAGQVDLRMFPIPLLHGNDGGRYIQTYGMNIVRTPDGKRTNCARPGCRFRCAGSLTNRPCTG